MSKFVITSEIKAAVEGRETEVLDALRIPWRGGHPHVTCPCPDHGDANPSWRWDDRASKARCTCTRGDDIFDVIRRVENRDFAAAKVRVAELIDRSDLIREQKANTHRGGQRMDAVGLLNPPSDVRDDSLVRAYLGHRLGIPAPDVLLPSTAVAGWKTLDYYDTPSPGSKAKPELVGTYPCAVFATVAADSRTHAHRIYLKPRGAGKADLGVTPDGRLRDPKKSAKRSGTDTTAGCSVIWGDADRAGHIMVCEGVETAAAVAQAMAAEMKAKQVAVAAAISATDIEAFQIYPNTTQVTVAADRDEGVKPDGKPRTRQGELAARKFARKHQGRIDVAIALPGEPGEYIDWLDVLCRGGASAVRAGILSAGPFAPSPAEEASKRGETGRPSIRVEGGDLAKAVEESLVVLAGEPDPHQAVYVRGNLLMRPTRVRDPLNAGAVRRPEDALILRVVDADWLRLRLSQMADFFVETRDGVALVNLPADICRCVLAAAPWEGVPTLSGIIEAPTILPDGRLIQTPGYDAATGLLFDPGNTAFPQIASAPTRAQAEAALRTLSVPFADFPFVDDASRSVALAAVLTALVRRPLRAAPLFAFDAPKMGSGKTLIATVCAYIATGRGPYLMAQVADPTDDRKRLLSALLEGPAIIVIDNVEHPLRSDSLCIALTEPTFTDRLLGQSRTATVATNSCFAATGNNLTIAGDLSARALLCRLDPAVERPEERTFALNLHEWVPAHRGKLVAAALTIILAYLAAGEPKPDVPHFARFEDWQRLCRFPLIWLGRADPCETRRRIEAGDPVRENLQDLLAAWHDQFGNRKATVKAAINAGTSSPDLQDAMETVAGEKFGINARKLGRFLAKYERRIEGGLRFVRDGDQNRALFWRAVGNELSELSELFSGPSREEKANGCDDAVEIDQWGRNSQNSSNSSPTHLVEVEL